MRIEAPQRERHAGRTRVSAEVHLDASSQALPRRFTVWYELPEAYAEYLSPRGDAFLVALLFLGMRLAEDIHVESVLSPRLVHGIYAYQRFFDVWFEHLTPVAIDHEGFEPAPAPDGQGGTAVLFSGGVDSFYSLRTHLPQNEPAPTHRISHGLFIEGFDTRVKQSLRTAREAYRKLFRELGLELLPVRTNLKRFVNDTTTGWIPAHGAFLTSVPLLLQGMLHRCFVPSTISYERLFGQLFGSNPIVDHLLSTESLEMVHDGAWVGRAEKIAAIADWPPTYDHLYVCSQHNEESLTNCCRCEKCIRTMIGLEIAGARDRYATFPAPLERSQIRSWQISDYRQSKPFVEDLLAYARSENRNDLAMDLRYAMAKHRIQQSRLGNLAQKLARSLVVEPARQSPLARRLYYRYIR